MDRPPSDPLKQPVSLKLLFWTLVGAAYVVAALAVASLYSKVLGLALLAPVLALVIVSIYRIPREQMARIAAQIEKQEQSAFGRFMRFVKIVLWALIGAAILTWLYERWQ